MLASLLRIILLTATLKILERGLDKGPIIVVFVGYLIWWGIAAWPVNNFVKGNNFNGKTVIPFATSISSGIGESDTLLAKMAGTGKWMPGMRFDENPSDSEVSQWLKAIGF